MRFPSAARARLSAPAAAASRSGGRAARGPCRAIALCRVCIRYRSWRPPWSRIVGCPRQRSSLPMVLPHRTDSDHPPVVGHEPDEGARKNGSSCRVRDMGNVPHFLRACDSPQGGMRNIAASMCVQWTFLRFGVPPPVQTSLAVLNSAPGLPLDVPRAALPPGRLPGPRGRLPRPSRGEAVLRDPSPLPRPPSGSSAVILQLRGCTLALGTGGGPEAQRR